MPRFLFAREMPRLTLNIVPSFFLFQAWHAWAYMNYEAVLFYKQQQTVTETKPDPSKGDSNGEEAASTSSNTNSKTDSVSNVKVLIKIFWSSVK